MKKEGNLKNLKEKTKNVFSKVKEKVREEEKDDVVVKPLVTSRVLFVSVLHKLFFISFAITAIIYVLTYVKYGINGVYFGGYFIRLISLVFGFALMMLGLWIYYLILNWLYKCVSKTMLCLTEKEVYAEMYAPFYRGEFSVPIDAVTKVDTVKILWIFRFIIIHRYHQMPIVFATWNAQEFKYELVKLLTDRKGKVANEFKNMEILPNWIRQRKKFMFIALALILVFVLVVFTFNYVNNPYRKIPGTYTLDDSSIVLNEDGSCYIETVVSKDIVSCNWSYIMGDTEDIPVTVNYEYQYRSSWYSNTYDSSLDLTINTKEKHIIYDDEVYLKEK